MQGNNPIRKPDMGNGAVLGVKSIFPTIQGEGPYAGVPAVFVRLGGCNLACHFCDTDFENFSERAMVDIVAEVKRIAGARRLVVITGGEPLRQNIAPLCETLLAAGFAVQIETNGTLWRELPEAVDIVCSPKNISGSYAPVRGDMLARVSAFKFIISKSDARYDHVADVGQGQTPVYVQPMDEQDDVKNTANVALAMQLAQTYGYRLSLQIHKMLGIE